MVAEGVFLLMMFVVHTFNWLGDGIDVEAGHVEVWSCGFIKFHVFAAGGADEVGEIGIDHFAN